MEGDGRALFEPAHLLLALGLVDTFNDLRIFFTPNLGDPDAAVSIGVLLANHMDFISPAMMDWTHSSHLIIIVVPGGMSTVDGSVLGVVGQLMLEETRSCLTEYWQIILRTMLPGIVVFARGDIDGMLAGLRCA